MKPEELEFLVQSNYIEQVYDEIHMRAAKAAWNFLKKQDRLTTKVILQTHKKLMVKHLPLNQRGKWRLCNVKVGIYDPPDRYQVPSMMDWWIKDANQTISGTPRKAEEIIKQDHITFERIHPFVDGNGRVGRMLLNWQRLQVGLPILVIKASHRWEYYDWWAQ